MFIALIVVGVGLVILLIVLQAKAARERREALAAFCRQTGLRFRAENDHSYDGRYHEFSALQRGSNRYAYNILTGTHRDRGFNGFDYHYETHSTDSKGRRQTHHHHFSALMIEAEIPLQPLFIRPEGFFDKVKEFFGADDIDFESAEFSRRFYVTAEDKKWAYDIIHAKVMEYLLEHREFSIQFGSQWCMIRKRGRFKIPDYVEAAEVLHFLLDEIPEYVRRQQADAFMD